MVSLKIIFFLTFTPVLILFSLSFIINFFSTAILTAIKKLRITVSYNLAPVNIIAESFYYFLIQLCFIITAKSNVKIWVWQDNLWLLQLLLFLILIVITFKFFLKTTTTTEISIIVSSSIFFYLTIILFFFINNFIEFLVLIELVSIFYYFFFLLVLDNKTISIVKVKNLLISYIWLSFFTMIFFVIGVLFLFYKIGTVDFFEVFLLSNYIPKLTWICLFIGLAFKLGLPGFHFFKLQIYEYLSLTIIFFFSIVSIFINNFILIFLFMNFWPVFLSLNIFFILIILLNNIFLIKWSLKLNSFYQFLAFSALNTWTTILMFMLI